ncbi:alpha/beta hydrolase [Chitinophaga tropicalis]|uniref:Alpha/beta hydrolase fold domain-containing protein n=1 Tax=Chitinophaga tropicalis TaxID=2683588 RepID=A0A7K1TZE3_9BACT|nr:alpha/beta hydrolase [Chitinophaga tropicalis]MVT07484.1 alpha/beta hydrolase fold domain-containing protein [Chitinophaga tropicalis]
MIRLTLLTIIFLVSLLAVFSAPTYHLWLLSIAVAEYAWVFVTIALVLLMAGFVSSGSYQLAGTLLGISAIALFLSPVYRACKLARELPVAMDKALGEHTSKKNSPPFSLWTMLTGFQQKAIPCSTISYRPDTLQSSRMDFYPAQATGLRPCVIVIHGGSWSSGDNKQLPELNTYLSQLGYHVASVNYRLAPAFRNPVPVEDVYAAIDYLRANAEDLQVDTSNFVLLGRSAGAQIALLAAYRQPFPGLKGVIDFYGPADMVWGYSAPANPWVMDSRKVLETYLGGSYKAVPDNYAASSPLEFVNSHSVPTLIIHGKNDVLVAYEHSIRLNNKLAANGIKHFFLSLPWATHGFDYNLNGPGGQLSTYAIKRFLQNVTE